VDVIAAIDVGGNTVAMVLLVELIKSSHPSVVDNCTEVVSDGW